MLSTNEMIEFLKNTYNLNISRELIFQYAKLGFLTPEKKRAGQKGKGLGVKTYWPNSAAVKVHIVKELLKKSLTLKDIKDYNDIIYKFNKDAITWYFSNNMNSIEELGPIEKSKFRTALTYFALAEANLKGNYKLYSLIKVVANNNKNIVEIHVILKDLDKPEIWDSKEHIETRFTADLVLLKREGMMIESPEELNVLSKLKTIKEVIFKAGSIEVL